MSTLAELTAEEFRRRLAGLEDVTGSAAFSADAFRQHATDLVVALAIAFNRRKLDATTLWTRIESGIKRGVTAAQGGDVDALIDAALRTVQASVNAIVCDEFRNLTAPFRKMQEDEVYSFCKYLTDHLYTAIMLGRQAWDERKEFRAAAAHVQTLDESTTESESDL